MPPVARETWVAYERRLERARVPVPQRPDALLMDANGQIVRAIEYGGDYSHLRLAELHYGLASIPLAYEIW